MRRASLGGERNPQRRPLLAIGAALAAIALASATGADLAQADADFYKGKQITIVESSSAGAYDAFARAMARFLPRYIPGKPTVIVQSMPGAGGVVAANYIYNVAPRDGSVFAGVHGNVLTAKLLSPSLAKFDPTKFSWLGNLTSDTYVGYVMRDAPIKTLEEARQKSVLMGGTSVGGAGIDMAIIARDLLGFKFKIISGYETSAAVELALTRREVQGTFAHAWSSLKLQKPDWIKQGMIRIIVQHGFERNPELPTVPLLLDYAKTDVDRQILNIELVRQNFAKPYMAPPGVPADRLAILRNAFESAERDPEFVRLITAEGLELNKPMRGEELAAVEERVMATPPELVKRLVDMLSGFQNRALQ
jgi:tripartite-type tricarboxylate transporter receptor subunit TctC